MTRSGDSAPIWRHAIAAVAQMVGPRGGGDLRSHMAPDAVRFVDDILNGADQESLVTKPRLFSELQVTPGKDLLDITFGCWREDEP